jgi:hypothetical protein
METIEPAFERIRFESWKDAYAFAEELNDAAPFFFRGQGNASWPLRSSLERLIGVQSGDTSRWDDCEKRMLRKFQSAAHHYLSNLPPDDNTVEWLSLMQHHGAPTRLLDCTYSFPVATFFAAKDATREAGFFAVWGFNYGKFMDQAGKRLPSDEFTTRGSVYSFSLQREMQEKANQFLNREWSGSLVIPVAPVRQNERIMAQQGLFLVPCCAGFTFAVNFAHTFLHCSTEGINDVEGSPKYSPDRHNGRCMAQLTAVKLILPFKVRLKTLVSLRRMNIHEASLFPGLDGFARSLSLLAYSDD